MKTWLECVSYVSIGSSSARGVSGVFVDLMFFQICSMRSFDVAMEVDRCFIRPTVRLGHVVKCFSFMDWIKVFLKGPNSVEWYHLASSILILAARLLSAAVCCWIVDGRGLWLG